MESNYHVCYVIIITCQRIIGPPVHLYMLDGWTPPLDVWTRYAPSPTYSEEGLRLSRGVQHSLRGRVSPIHVASEEGSSVASEEVFYLSSVASEEVVHLSKGFSVASQAKKGSIYSASVG